MTAKSPKNNANSKVPKLRHHKGTGQAYAVFDQKAIYFGRFDDTGSTQRYHQFVAEWIAAGKQVVAEPEQITVAELIARFWTHAEGYYIRADGSHTDELNNIRQAMRPLSQLYAAAKVTEFGPKALCTVRQKMIELDWCRNNINKMINRIRLMFKWGAAHEIVPGSIYHALAAVPGLKHARSDARETEPVKPVPQDHIDAIQPYVSRQVWALIQLQLLTAARSGELVVMRPCDIDRSGRIWTYRPAQHKTAHHGHIRIIYIGPKGQEIIRHFLLRPAEAYCFSPAEAEAERQLRRALERKTPVQYGNRPGTNVKDGPKKSFNDHYDVKSYGNAIETGIKQAFRPEGMAREEFEKWKCPQHWHPHQLRHNAATYLRKEFGLEITKIILGHQTEVMTEIYAERDKTKAIEAILKVG